MLKKENYLILLLLLNKYLYLLIKIHIHIFIKINQLKDKLLLNLSNNYNNFCFLISFCNFAKFSNCNKIQFSPFLTYLQSIDFQDEFFQYFYVHYHYPTAFLTCLMVFGRGMPYLLMFYEFNFGAFQSLSSFDQNYLLLNQILEVPIEIPTIPTLELISEEEKVLRLKDDFYYKQDTFTISTQELIELKKKQK